MPLEACVTKVTLWRPLATIMIAQFTDYVIQEAVKEKKVDRCKTLTKCLGKTADEMSPEEEGNKMSSDN